MYFLLQCQHFIFSKFNRKLQFSSSSHKKASSSLNNTDFNKSELAKSWLMVTLNILINTLATQDQKTGLDF